MDGADRGDMLLGRQAPVVDSYAPQLLYPIPRATGRERIGVEPPLPFYGTDLWHAYELSWLDGRGKPQVRVGRLQVSASSPNLVESKSLKLYFNSLNNTRFSDKQELARTICGDVAAVVGCPVELELLEVTDPGLAGTPLEGDCLDGLAIAPVTGEPVPGMLEVGEAVCEQKLYSHLLRSLCPVTGQPDWATLWLHCRGATLRPESLLRYIVAFRHHQEFHEQCVERIFCDIQRRCRPAFLHIQAFYTRRGGLDINPFRSTDPDARPLPRLDRQ